MAAARNHGCAAQLGQQLRRPRRGTHRKLPVHLALEAVGGLAEQPVPPADPGRAPRGEVGGLDHQIRRRPGDLGRQAAHGASHRNRPGFVGDQDVVGVKLADDMVQRLQPLTRLRPPHHDRAGQPVAVEGVQRLPQLDHQVVGDVDRQRHRAHARPGQPHPHPQRSRRGRVETVHLAQHEPVAGGRVGDARRVHIWRHRLDVGGQMLAGRVGVRDFERRGQFAGNPAHRQRISQVRRHRDVEYLVGQPGVAREILAERGIGREHQDAGVVVPDGEFGGGADHALRHPAVGLFRADLEATGQHRTGSREWHPVADREVGRAADHVALGRAGGHVAVPDRLAEPGQLLDGGDLRHHDTADVVPDGLDGLHLQARGGQPPGHLGGRNRLIDRGVLAQPGHWDAHQTSTPSARLNRTSPSSESLISVIPCRTMSVRSMPSPNAKPL